VGFWFVVVIISEPEKYSNVDSFPAHTFFFITVFPYGTCSSMCNEQCHCQTDRFLINTISSLLVKVIYKHED